MCAYAIAIIKGCKVRAWKKKYQRISASAGGGMVTAGEIPKLARVGDRWNLWIREDGKQSTGVLTGNNDPF